jgi:hypothetical protein
LVTSIDASPKELGIIGWSADDAVTCSEKIIGRGGHLSPQTALPPDRDQLFALTYDIPSECGDPKGGLFGTITFTYHDEADASPYVQKLQVNAPINN